MSQILSSRGLFHKSFAHAGLSADCKTSFFHNSTKVCAYRVNLGSVGQQKNDPIFVRKLEEKNRIADVSLSNTVMAISTQECLELHRLTNRSTMGREIKIPHGGWSPSGLATWEHDSLMCVAIGQSRQVKGCYEGRITVYHLAHRERAEVFATYKLPMQDFPKKLSFENQGQCLTCITEIRNSVVVWTLGDPNPFVITKYLHKPVSKSAPHLEETIHL